MDENEHLAQIICEQVGRGTPLVLVSLVNLQWSTPRRSGTKMVVGADSKNYGTICGSLLEATAIQESRNVLDPAQSKMISYGLNGKDANTAGMICGGKAELLLGYIPATEDNREIFRRWYDKTRRGDNLYFLTNLKGTGDTIEILGRFILYPNDKIKNRGT